MLDTSDPLRNIGPRNYIEVQQNTITTFIISDVVVKISEVQNEDNKRKKVLLYNKCVSPLIIALVSLIHALEGSKGYFLTIILTKFEKRWLIHV